MVKTLTAPATTEKNSQGTFPITLVEIEWTGAPGTKQYTAVGQDYSFDSKTWKSKIVDFGQIDNSLSNDNSGVISDVSLEFQNNPADPERISDFFATINPVGKKLTIWKHFDGNGAADLVELFQGRIWSPVSYGKDGQTIRISAREESQFHRARVGDIVDDTTYTDAPRESIGKMLPIVYGEAKNVPAVKVQEEEKAELAESIISTTEKIKLKPRFPGDDFSNWPTGAHEVKIDSEHISITSFSPTTRELTVNARGISLQTGLTADAGSTAGTLIDAALTEDEGFWVGYIVAMTSGANSGLEREVVSFNATTDTLTFGSDFPSAIGTGDTYDIVTKAVGHNAGAAVQVIGNAHIFVVADHPVKDISNVRIGDRIADADTFTTNTNDTTFEAAGQATISFHHQPLGSRRTLTRALLRIDGDDAPQQSRDNRRDWAVDGSTGTYGFVSEETTEIIVSRNTHPLTEMRQRLGPLKRSFLVVKHQNRNALTTDSVAIAFKPQGGSFTTLGTLDKSLPLFDENIEQQKQDVSFIGTNLVDIESQSFSNWKWTRIFPSRVDVGIAPSGAGFWANVPSGEPNTIINDGDNTTLINRRGSSSATQGRLIDMFYKIPNNIGRIRRVRIFGVWGGSNNQNIDVAVRLLRNTTTITSLTMTSSATETSAYSATVFFDEADAWSDFNDGTLFVRLEADASTDNADNHWVREVSLEIEYAEMTPGEPYSTGGIGTYLDGIALLDDRKAEIMTTVFDITDDIGNDWNNFFESQWKATYSGTANDLWVAIFDFYIVAEFERFELQVSDEVYADVDGVDATGDGTGALLENPADIIEDILENRMGIAPADIDSTSFSATQTSLSTVIAGGYKWAFALFNQMDSRDLLADLAWQCRCRLFWEGIYKLTFRADAFGTADGTLSGSQIQVGAMNFQYNTDQLVAEYIGYYAKDYSLVGDLEFISKSITKTDATAQTSYGENRVARDLWAIRHFETADDVLDFHLLQNKNPRQIIMYSTFLNFLEFERGDIIEITDSDEGLSSTKFEILRQVFIPGNLNKGVMDTLKFTAWRPGL